MNDYDPENTQQQKIQLNALSDLSVDNEQLLTGGAFSSDTHEALEHIIARRAELAVNQIDPPFVILQKLNLQFAICNLNIWI